MKAPSATQRFRSTRAEYRTLRLVAAATTAMFGAVAVLAWTGRLPWWVGLALLGVLAFGEWTILLTRGRAELREAYAAALQEGPAWPPGFPR